MPEAKLSVEVGAKIDQLKAGMAQAKASVSDFSKSANKSLVEADHHIHVSGNKYIRVSERMAEEAAAFAKAQRLAATETAQAGNTIVSTANKSGNALTRAYNSLNKLTYLLPGIGIAGLFSLAYDALKPLISQLDLFNSKLSETQTAAKLVNDALASSGYTDAVKTVNELSINIGLAKDGLLNKEKVLNQYNETIGKTTGKVSSLDEAEQALVKNGPAFIQMTLHKAVAQLALEEASKKAFEAAQTRLKKSEDVANFGDKAKAGLFQSFFQSTEFNPESTKEYEKNVKISGAKRRKANAQELDKEKNSFIQIAKDSQNKAAQIASSLGLDFFGGDQDGKSKSGKTRAQKLSELKKQQQELKNSNLLSGLEASQKILLQQDKLLDNLQNNKSFSTSKNAVIPVILGGDSSYVKAEVTKPFADAFSDIGSILLPELGSSFQTFFDDMLTKGKFSFDALGNSILKTFTSVLASQATTGLLSLLGDPEAKSKPSIFKSIGGALGIGGGGGGGGKGIGALLGTILPVAGIAVGALSLFGGLGKKKDKTLNPAYVSNNNLSTPSGGSSQNLTVIMKQQGRDLVGVLNLEGYYLSRVQQNGRGG